MVNLTRLDCMAGSAGLMRQATAQAIHHTGHRRAFGALLADQPLMSAVLADLAVESEAATALTIRRAGAVDRSELAGEADGGPDDVEHERLLRRIGTAVGKYWVCKRAPAVTAEALECLGGNGYVEESIMPRLYREAPLNSLWEGSGNVNVLDVLRVLSREPQTGEALLAEVGRAAGGDARLDARAKHLGARLARLPADLTSDPAAVQRDGRGLVEEMALALQGALLVRHAPGPVADAFCATRLDAGSSGRAFGAAGSAIPTGNADLIVDRHTALRD
jgi:putative acyl-CoA dehydrogenase